MRAPALKQYSDTDRLEWIMESPLVRFRILMRHWPWKKPWREVLDSLMRREGDWTELVRQQNQRDLAEQEELIQREGIS